MLIGELSRRTGVNAHQLRYYEAQGLLTPIRGSNGYRRYSDDTVVTVTQISKLLEAGLSTEEIEFLLPCATGTGPELEPCADLLTALRARLDLLDDRIDTLTRSRRALQDYIDSTERRAPQAALRSSSDTERVGACPADASPPRLRREASSSRMTHGPSDNLRSGRGQAGASKQAMRPNNGPTSRSADRSTRE